MAISEKRKEYLKVYREDNKENITSGMKATSEDLERAKKKI